MNPCKCKNPVYGAVDRKTPKGRVWIPCKICGGYLYLEPLPWERRQ